MTQNHFMTGFRTIRSTLRSPYFTSPLSSFFLSPPPPKKQHAAGLESVLPVAAVSGDLYVCPFLFDFLTVREVGKAACVCRAWREAAEDDELWRELYARTQVTIVIVIIIIDAEPEWTSDDFFSFPFFVVEWDESCVRHSVLVFSFSAFAYLCLPFYSTYAPTFKTTLCSCVLVSLCPCGGLYNIYIYIYCIPGIYISCRLEGVSVGYLK